jgi:glutamyl-tRNA synthetase
MNSDIRVRFAPSPTGPLHIGGVRTALYNYLFAKKNHGTFILRIEDTDQTRFVKQAQEYIIESLKWCGINPDEGPGIGGEFGPYVQSERKDIYEKYIQKLIDLGHAYYAFDTAAEIDEKREEAKTKGNNNWQYDGSTRNSMCNSLTLSAQETQDLLSQNAPYTVRALIPQSQTVIFRDEIRGQISIQTDILDDKVLFKSDGLPTYHFANIVDDHLMQISHVIRGEEWLPSTALHHLLYQFFGWKAPTFAHLPLILKPDGKGKLSKRDGDKLGFPVFPLNWLSAEGETFPGYKEQGYLPEAFINMLALLGWSPGDDRELFTLPELVEAYSLEKTNKSGARFDPEKTKWFQQQYLKNRENRDILKDVIEQLPTSEYSVSTLERIVGLFKERVIFALEIPKAAHYFFSDVKLYDEKTHEKKWKENTAEQLLALSSVFEQLDDFSSEKIEAAFQNFLEVKEIPLGQLMPNLRLVLTGEGGGPQLFEIAEILGKNAVIDRIQKGIKALEK